MERKNANMKETRIYKVYKKAGLKIGLACLLVASMLVGCVSMSAPTVITQITAPTESLEASMPSESNAQFTESSMTEPTPTETEATESSKPVDGEFGQTTPTVTEPTEAAPIPTEPVETEPAPTEPPATEPPATEPASTETPATEPTVTEPQLSYPLTYSDETCTITVYKEWYENAWVYAAHIEFTDYDRLWVECANGKYNSGGETTSHAAQRVGAILAINGDYAVPGNGASGYAIARDGVVCNDKKIYSEGIYNAYTGKLTYRTDVSGKLLSDMVAAQKLTDTFQFAPAVLIDGTIYGESSSSSRAQRTFIGTNGNAGDIWLCVSDGRYNDGESAGLNAYQCGAYLKSKGCTLGVPLDGGGSSAMYFNGKVLNSAAGNERAVVDFLVFK